MKGFETFKVNLIESLSSFFDWKIKDERFYSSMAKVVSVDDSGKTCNVSIINGEDLDDVRLQQVSSITGLFIKPSINSVVIVAWTDKTTAYVSMYSQIDEIIFQDGTNGGLIKISDLVSRINDLENLFTSLKTDFAAWAPVPNDGGAALKAVLSAGYLTKTVPTTVRGDFENTNFTH